MATGIKANWSIGAAGGRSATVDGLRLIVAKPVKGTDLPWLIEEGGQPVFWGITRYGSVTKYQSQVRQAMFDAEQAAAELVK